MIGAVYILHFVRPIGAADNPRGQARHYIGWAVDPEARDAAHRAGRGAALTRAAVALGVDWTMFVLTEGDRALERRLKALKSAPRLCPVCGRTHPRGALHVPAQVHQLALDLVDEPDFGDIPAPAWPAFDGYELVHIRAWRQAAAQRYDVPELVGELPF